MTLYSEVRAARCKETGFTMKCTDQHFYAQHFYVSQAQLLCSTFRIPEGKCSCVGSKTDVLDGTYLL